MDFSVIIPAYNVSDIIGRAIRSAAAQTFAPLEILIIDDCSTDNTVEVVKALGRDIPALRLLSTPANTGPAAARNVGLRAAKGDWIALLDSDDAWKPGRLKRLSEVASATSADFVADNLVMWDAVADAHDLVEVVGAEGVLHLRPRVGTIFHVAHEDLPDGQLLLHPVELELDLGVVDAVALGWCLGVGPLTARLRRLEVLLQPVQPWSIRAKRGSFVGHTTSFRRRDLAL